MTISTSRLAKSPAALDFVQAAALSSVGAVAIIALVDKARLQAGERLLLSGNVLLSQGKRGLQDYVTPVVSVDYTF